MPQYRSWIWASRVADRTPGPVLYRAAVLAGEIAYLVNHGGRRVALANMRRALGPRASQAAVRRAARGCFRASALFYADHVVAARTDAATLFREHVNITGLEHLSDAAARGRGVIVASLHYGNPVLVGQCASALGLRVLGLAEPLQPPLDTLFERYRTRGGLEMVDANVSGIRQALRFLRAGGVVGIAVDRDVQHNGIDVTVMGAVARVPGGAVDLASRTGAALLPGLSRRVGLDRFHVVLQPPLDLVCTGDRAADRVRNTMRLFERFAPYLRRDPSQWFLLEEPLWPDQPQPRPATRAASLTM